jgi:hypothetical protein
MDTVPVVVGFQVMVYGMLTGTMSPRPGLAIGLQASVHWVVGAVALTRAADAARKRSLNCIFTVVYLKKRLREGEMW